MQHPFENYVQVPEMIGVRTNVPGFRWGFGACSTPAGDEAFESCKIKVFLEARKDSEVFEETDLAAYTETFRDFRARPEAKAVIFEKKIGPVHLRYSITVDGNQVKVIVGRTYLRLIKYKIMYIHAIWYVLFDLVSLLLLKENMTTLYGSAAVLPGGRTVFCSAAPNTGKSVTVLQLQNKFGARILAEDMAVTDGERIWGAPYTGLYRNYHDEALKSSKQSSENDSFAQRIDAVFLLQKGSPDREIQTDAFFHQLLLINRYSLGYYYSPCVRVLDYYNRALDVNAAQAAEERILDRLVSTAKTTIVVRQNSMDYAKYIHDSMAGETPQGEN